MKKREVPKKNYLIFFVLSVFVVCLCFYLATWYKTLNEYYSNKSALSLSSVKNTMETIFAIYESAEKGSETLMYKGSFGTSG